MAGVIAQASVKVMPWQAVRRTASSGGGPEPGVGLVRTATVVPDNERWLHTSQAAADIQSALTWAQAHPPSDANVDAMLEGLHDRG